MPSINDYDHYAALRQKELQHGEKLPHRYVEKPAMESVLPDLGNKRVLMLGCGSGEEALLLENHGATDLVGIDLSSESIRLARKSYPKHQFLVGDMHHLDFPDGKFDFVYSSLTVHYSSDPLSVYEEVCRVLIPGGYLQFSVAHPIRWASERITLGGKKAKVLGYTEGDGKPRLFGSYNNFAEYQETFPSGEVLQFWVGPPSMHFSLLKKAGFSIEEFVETHAIAECKEEHPEYYERSSNFPQFTVFVAKKC